MREVAEKLRAVELELSTAKGPFDLFALFLREDAPDVWDLMVAAAWIDEAPSVALSEISRRVRNVLGPTLITRLSRVVHITRDNPALGALAASVDVSNSIMEVSNSVFSGVHIKHAFLMTVRPTAPHAPAASER